MDQAQMKQVDAATLKTWLAEGQAVLIDVREPDEHAREHIAGSRLVPVSRIDQTDFSADHGKIAVFHCASGQRTREAAPHILGAGFKAVYQLEGGLQGWKNAGLAVELDRKAPISLMRQVQIVAGGMVVLGALLAVFVSPWFLALSGFVGAGLMFSGISGTCAMASLLALMPWNRATTAATDRA